METTPLDPSLPGVRMLQNWIREGLAVSIAVLDQERIEGRLIWQDPEFLALERLGSTRPVLIARRHITLIRSIDGSTGVWHDRSQATCGSRERCLFFSFSQ